ncbi:hypothetical protein I204_00822 [Kwoniella mangroviensis CBS 8886]|uniref:uncharacterized protein n=1 Tax=Kwoniella mangroviensis CBS 8507 TaxID=1296122 RepID=UPI00080D3562|nr:uncharacterized protein I203_05778 [Kwoniella mangroviensis CBS 8507]OCF65036.1 hypothetical protein I203_05778 [Kwoniella mangroviensis CBS 8507]OCF78878.1 hypothetical protein I204_00822 [Kwoniella mangroviensis CBS 8886]
MGSFYTDLPTLNLPPISSQTDSETEMSSSNRLIQPLDLSRYQLPSLPPTEASSPIGVGLQVSHDRSCQIDHNDTIGTPSNLSLSPPQLVQNSHSAPPSAAPYQSSFSFPQIQPEQLPRRVFAQQPPTQNFPWLERGGDGLSTQIYETPYQSYRPSPQPNSNHIQHNHSHSTPSFFSMPLSQHSDTSTPFQHSQLCLTPYTLPVDLQDATTTNSSNDIPLPLQKNESDDYSLPEGIWESNAPYPQPDVTPEKRGKNRDGLVKSRKHFCPVCDKRFNRPSSLNTHMAVHTGAKPYMCSRPDCQRRFSVSSNLRRHERTHEQRAEKERQAYDIPSRSTHPHPYSHSHAQPFSMGHSHSNSHSHSSYSHPGAFPQTHPHQSFNFNYYQPSFATASISSGGYSERGQQPPHAVPSSVFGSSSTTTTSAGSSIDLGYGLAQYQVVAAATATGQEL